MRLKHTHTQKKTTAQMRFGRRRLVDRVAFLLHMEERKTDLTLSLSFSLFLMRGKIFRADTLRTREHEGGRGGGEELE